MGVERIHKALSSSKGPVLNIFFTAGHPELESTIPIIKILAEAGVDLIEIGIPYSDPIADGPVIQQSSEIALSNGMTINKLLDQLENLRTLTDIPIILMGYINPVLQYGFEKFVKKASDIGIDGLILPDLPPELYERSHQELFRHYDLASIMLVSPQTPDSRIRYIDRLSSGFIYAVSSASTTGSTSTNLEKQRTYFKHLDDLELTNKHLIGFGIHDRETFKQATEFADGAIIGSAFVKLLQNSGSEYLSAITPFIQSIRPPKLT